jgi:hypothetical protein
MVLRDRNRAGAARGRRTYVGVLVALAAGALAPAFGACSSKPGQAGGGDAGLVDAARGVAIGPDGGTLSAYGVAIDVPPGALATSVALSVTPSSEEPPAGYALVSSFYRFEPEGTTFAVPVAVHFQTDATEATVPGASVHWSLPGGGYEAIATTWSGSTASAQVTHFSAGFVGLVATADGGASDRSTVDGAAEAGNAMAAGDAGDGGDAGDAADALDEANDGAPTSDGAAGAGATDGGTTDAGATDGGTTDAGATDGPADDASDADSLGDSDGA